jgi:mRNA interferase HicA
MASHRTLVCDSELTKGSEFLKKVQKVAKSKGLRYSFVPAKGKGSHGTLYVGQAFTTVKDRKKELGSGLLRSMCRDLGIDPNEL